MTRLFPIFFVFPTTSIYVISEAKKTMKSFRKSFLRMTLLPFLESLKFLKLFFGCCDFFINAILHVCIVFRIFLSGLSFLSSRGFTVRKPRVVSPIIPVSIAMVEATLARVGFYNQNVTPKRGGRFNCPTTLSTYDFKVDFK
jgi:hypothetical protein